MIREIFVSLIFAILAVPAFAVTEKEMEEARAITAQAYLRYANDGSGYLDEFRATSMSQLESKLKAREKENLKAFKTVKVPGDYASWDKARLVEFWGVTFFTSPNLAEKGKAARTRVKQRINAMTIAAPTPKEEKPAEPALVEEPEEIRTAETAAADVASDSPAVPGREDGKALEKQEDILADQNAIAQDTEDRKYEKEDSGTWIYVLVLVVLIGVVIWLVVFAANMMRKQSEPLEQGVRDAGNGTGGKEDAEMHRQLASMKTGLEEYKTAFEEAQAENKRLRSELKALKAELSEVRATQTAVRASGPVAENPRPAAAQPSVLYLGRVNGRGLFVRADRRFNPGHSIYRLETRDGLVGTFHVVDTPEVADIALKNPVEYLSGGCTAIDIEDTAGARNIMTENAGTAMFENGTWKVLRKSRIRFE